MEPRAYVKKEQLNMSKMIHPYNIKFATLLQIIYQGEWESYFNNQNAMTFMILNANELINWVHIMFNHMKKKVITLDYNLNNHVEGNM